MGYSTDFYGHFTVDPPLKAEHAAYLRAFNNTRRMKRDALKAALRPDPKREAVGLPVGDEAGYFVGEPPSRPIEMPKHAVADDVVDYNTPPEGQPGLWCQWIPGPDGTTIEWDGGEKFYCYAEWLQYLLDHFLLGWGYKLGGVVEFQGEDFGDSGELEITDNGTKVHVHFYSHQGVVTERQLWVAQEDLEATRKALQSLTSALGDFQGSIRIDPLVSNTFENVVGESLKAALQILERTDV